MKDIIFNELRKHTEHTRELKLHLFREQLQNLILRIIDEKKFFSQIIFVGGTALRFLFNTKRFSEDLDFSLDPAQKEKFKFQFLIETIQKSLQDYGFPSETKQKTEGAVNNCFFKFPNILYELDPHFRTHQKLSIRLDIDTNPPLGFHLETTGIVKDVLIKIKHYDKPSLFAGKLHAILCRNYLKGRDIYDFIWFCASNIPVNLSFLNNAYKQSQKISPPWTEKTFPEVLSKKISDIDLEKAFSDASLYMEDLSEKRFFDKELLQSMARKIQVI